jgi:23S rRNA G2445 N2-methylase RlmL
VAERSAQRRLPRADLAARVEEAGFTPSARDLDGLLDLVGNESSPKAAERAIARVGASALTSVLKRLDVAAPRLRSLLVRVVGRLVKQGSREGVPVLVTALEDADPKTRRNAAIALGGVRSDEVEGALLRAWDKDPRLEMQRSIAAALGKVGTERSLPLLRDARAASDPQLARIAGQAVMMVERTASRTDRGSIDGARAPGRPTNVVVLARKGLEDLLADELSSCMGVSEIRRLGPGRVAAKLGGPLETLFRARTMLGLRFEMPSEWVRDRDTVSAAIARAVSSEAARAVFDAWTSGPVRYRIAWADGGHRRAATWDAARAIAQREPRYVNDPTLSTWELVVAQHGRRIDVALAPRALRDPRFSWRVADVPAASHPTIAAALARVATARPNDVVWDPFVGSGAELIERALLGPYRSLIGSDIDSRALAAARRNLSAARVDARLDEGSALAVTPEGVTLIVTNPPMGRRSSRSGTLREMLSLFMVHAASLLGPKGRLVWMAPWPASARSTGLQVGLELESARVVDLGGFDVELQRWVKSGR